MGFKQTFYPFEALARKQLRKLKETAFAAQLFGYVDGDGDVQPVQGDEFGPYIRPVGVASEDAVAVANGEPQLPLYDLYGKQWSASGVILTDEETLLTDVAAAAAGAFTATAVIDVAKWRRLNVSIRYVPGAVGGYPQIVPLRAKTASEPLITTDNWYGFGASDGSISAAALTGAFPASTTATITPAWAISTQRGLVLRTETATGVEAVRLDVELNVESVKWVYFLYAEKGITATPGTVGLRYNLSTG
jgi:hypothetical protein